MAMLVCWYISLQPFGNNVKKKKWSLLSQLAHRAGAYPCFRSMKRLGVFLLPLDGMLVHRRSLPSNLLGFPNKSPVPIYTPGWREALWEWSVSPKNTTQCPRPGVEPWPLDPWTSALTMRPPRLRWKQRDMAKFCVIWRTWTTTVNV